MGNCILVAGAPEEESDFRHLNGQYANEPSGRVASFIYDKDTLIVAETTTVTLPNGSQATNSSGTAAAICQIFDTAKILDEALAERIVAAIQPYTKVPFSQGPASAFVVEESEMKEFLQKNMGNVLAQVWI